MWGASHTCSPMAVCYWVVVPCCTLFAGLVLFRTKPPSLLGSWQNTLSSPSAPEFLSLTDERGRVGVHMSAYSTATCGLYCYHIAAEGHLAWSCVYTIQCPRSSNSKDLCSTDSQITKYPVWKFPDSWIKSYPSPHMSYKCVFLISPDATTCSCFDV